jgi:hypothetical protein
MIKANDNHNKHVWKNLCSYFQHLDSKALIFNYVCFVHSLVLKEKSKVSYEVTIWCFILFVTVKFLKRFVAVLCVYMWFGT